MGKTTVEKIESINQEIEQLKNRAKLLNQQHKAAERKARTRRLCARHGLLESMLPETITLTEEQFKTFIEKAVANDYGRRILTSITAKGSGATATPKPAEAAQSNRVGGAQTTQDSVKQPS